MVKAKSRVAKPIKTLELNYPMSVNNTHLKTFLYHFFPYFFQFFLEETAECIDHGSRALVPRISDQTLPAQRSRVVAHASGAGHGLHAVC